MDAQEESQKYKVGKFILETKRVSIDVLWEEEEVIKGDDQGNDWKSGGFDSGDEDECEELFSGTWTREGAQKRRSERDFTQR